MAWLCQLAMRLTPYNPNSTIIGRLQRNAQIEQPCSTGES
jgi:hypothetical protein